MQALFPDSLLCPTGLGAARLPGGSPGPVPGRGREREGVEPRGGQDQGQLPSCSPGWAWLRPAGKQGLSGEETSRLA